VLFGRDTQLGVGRTGAFRQHELTTDPSGSGLWSAFTQASRSVQMCGWFWLAMVRASRSKLILAKLMD